MSTRWRSGPTFAEALWKGAQRTAYVRTLKRPDGSTRSGRVAYHTLHEVFGHGVDDDRMHGKRKAARKLMRPYPTSWSDVDGLKGMAAYWRLPSECFANRMVEAITHGVVRSMFDDDYTRTIPDEWLDELVDLVLTQPPDPVDVDPPVPPTIEPPSPADDQLIALRAAVAQADAAIRSELDTLTHAAIPGSE